MFAYACRRRAAAHAALAAAALAAAAAASSAGVAPPAGATPSPAAAAPMRFDFGTPDSPVADGYVRVTERTAYTPARGYGWHEGDEVVCRDRERGDALRRDLCFAQWAEFMVDLPDGVYDVTVLIGDEGAAHEEMGLVLQGQRVDSVTTAAGEVVERTRRVTVTGGRLSVTVDDLGGEDVNAVIDALTITGVAGGR
jgi:large repetitive protein